MSEQKAPELKWLPDSEKVLQVAITLTSMTAEDEEGLDAAEDILRAAQRVRGWQRRNLAEIARAATTYAKTKPGHRSFPAALIRLSRLYRLGDLMSDKQAR